MCGLIRYWCGVYRVHNQLIGTEMTRMALTALGLIGAAIWIDGLDGAGTLASTVILGAVFLAIGAMFFWVIGGIGVLS